MANASHAPKRGRFPVVPSESRTMGGVTFDSKREMLRWAELQLLQRAGEITELKRQVSYSVSIASVHFCKFTPDAEYIDRHGVKVFEDVKSSGTAKDTAYRLRKKAFEIFYGVKVTEIIR